MMYFVLVMSNLDHIVGSADLLAALTCFGIPGCLTGDLDHNGIVTFLDIAMLLSRYGELLPRVRA